MPRITDPFHDHHVLKAARFRDLHSVRRSAVETCVAPWAGFVYVDFVIDVYAHYLVGWRVEASRVFRRRFDLDHATISRFSPAAQ